MNGVFRGVVFNMVIYWNLKVVVLLEYSFNLFIN